MVPQLPENIEDLKDALRRLPDDQLLLVVETGDDYYWPDAISRADEEVDHRGGIDRLRYRVSTMRAQFPQAPTAPPVAGSTGAAPVAQATAFAPAGMAAAGASANAPFTLMPAGASSFPVVDRVLLGILLAVFSLLSLWGGSQHWAGSADPLPFVMLFFGAIFLIVESIRLASPKLGALFGAAIPASIILPSFLLYTPRSEEVVVLVYMIMISTLLGLIISAIAWACRRTPARSLAFPQAAAPPFPPQPAYSQQPYATETPYDPQPQHAPQPSYAAQPTDVGQPAFAPLASPDAFPAQLPPAQWTPAPPVPLRGVGGWLQFFVVIKMYVSPVVFVIASLFQWLLYLLVAEDYPGVILVGFVQTLAGIFFVGKWVLLARALRDIQPRAVHQAKTWLAITLAWSIVSALLITVSGMDVTQLLPRLMIGMVVAVVGFLIWFTYFSVSERVKATYPDWNQ